MEYVPFLLICLTLLLPVFLPLIYWYILRKKESKIYGYCSYARRFWAVMVVFMLAVKLFKLSEREAYNSYEVMGEFAGQFLCAFLLWKKWKKSIDSVKPEGVIYEQN